MSSDNTAAPPAAAASAPDSSAAPATSLAPSTPSLVSILAAFQKAGQNDVDLLKLILRAKEKEDERLAADAQLKAEQLKVQHTLVLSQIYYAQQQAQQQYAAQFGPFSPTSPPVDHAPMSPYHLVPPCRSSIGSDTSPPPESAKRSRASSTTSAISDASDPGAKRLKRSGAKPTHDDVMLALRNKCERNAQQAQGANATSQAPAPRQQRPIAPRPSPPATSTVAAAEKKGAMAPPSRTSKSQSPPARHSALFATRPIPAQVPSAVDEKSPSLKMLLNAVNTHTLQQTSNARSDHVAAPTPVA